MLSGPFSDGLEMTAGEGHVSDGPSVVLKCRRGFSCRYSPGDALVSDFANFLPSFLSQVFCSA